MTPMGQIGIHHVAAGGNMMPPGGGAPIHLELPTATDLVTQFIPRGLLVVGPSPACPSPEARNPPKSLARAVSPGVASIRDLSPVARLRKSLLPLAPTQNWLIGGATLPDRLSIDPAHSRRYG
jgi:hypothetical protein